MEQMGWDARADPLTWVSDLTRASVTAVMIREALCVTENVVGKLIVMSVLIVIVQTLITIVTLIKLWLMVV